MKIHSATWHIAALQFATYGARGLFLPFANLYLISQGFTGAQIGTLISLNALAQLIISPLLNQMADRTARHRRLYFGLSVTNIVALGGFILPLSKAWLGGMLVTRTVSDNAGNALLSQLTITWMSERGRKIYGRLRSLGSLGWALSTLVAGTIFALGGYPLLFIGSGLILIVSLPLIAALPKRTAEKPANPKAKGARSGNFYLLAAGIFLFYVGFTVTNGFAFIYFQRELGADNGMIGLVASISALSEIPAMLLIDRLLRRWNVRATLVVGMIGLALMWLAYSVLVGASLLIPLMLLRGTFFTFHTVSITLLVAEISHPAQAATNQAIMQVTVPGLATLLTGAVSGWMFDALGGRVLFQIVGLLGLISALLIVLIRRRLTTAPSDLVPLPEPDIA